MEMGGLQPGAREEGFSAGLARIERGGVELPGDREHLLELMGPASEVIQQYEEDPAVNERFVAFLWEATTVAAAARWVYAESDLTKDDVHSFAGSAATFLNSFSHR